MKRPWLVIGGIALLAVAVALSFWFLRPRGLAVYREALARRDYDLARSGLTEELRAKPLWHEARALLAEVELAAGYPLAALEQIARLWEDKWETGDLVELFLASLPNELAIQAISALEALPPSVGRGELALAIALKFGDPSLIARGLPLLNDLQPGNPLVSRAWQQLKTDDPHTAWLTADKLGTSYKKNLAREMRDQGTLDLYLPGILHEDPLAPLILEEVAAELGGLAGLDLLLAMEKTGWSPTAPISYSETKFTLLLALGPDRLADRLPGFLDIGGVKKVVDLLVQKKEKIRPALDLLQALEAGGFAPAETKIYAALKLELLKLAAPPAFRPSFFAGIPGEDLLNLAELWVYQVACLPENEEAYPRETIAALLAHLAKDKDCRQNSLFLQSLLSPPPPPQPRFVLANQQRLDQDQLGYWEVSPEGRHVLYSGWDFDATYWFDLEKQVHVGEFSGPFYGVWTQNLVAFIPAREGKILTYNTDSAAKLAEFPWSPTDGVLGWQDGRLVLARPAGAQYKIVALDPATGAEETVLSTPALPSLTPTGKLGWLTPGQDAIRVKLADKETVYSGGPGSGWHLYCWLPGDKGALLTGDGGYKILDFTEGKYRSIEGPGGFVPAKNGWLDEYRIAGTVTLTSPTGEKLAVFILDTRDMSAVHTGLEFTEGVVLGKTVYFFLDGDLRVYALQ